MIKRKYITLLILLFTFTHVFSNVTFRASAPSTVINGSQFEVSFTVTDGNAEKFRGPDFPDFEVKFGPSTSRSSSTVIGNNQVSTNSAIKYTYILQASKEGSFTIAPATVSVDGKTYTSNSIKIKIVPRDKNAPTQQQPGVNIQRGESLGSSSATSQNVSPQDLYLRLSVSKQDVYEQECIVATLKLFSRYDNTATDGTNAKIPDFQGFLMQDIEVPHDKPWQHEYINGLNYKTVVLRQWLLYPQRSGTFTIDPAKLDAIVTVVVPRQNSVFNSLQDVRKTLYTPTVKINVKALPVEDKPVPFSGGVGEFTFSSTLTPEHPKANEALTLTLKYEGIGNIKLLKDPEVKFPADIEVYDPKITNDFVPTANGFSGSKTIEYMAIPRHQGNYVIPAVEFSYFDLKSKRYKTVKSQEYTVKVEKGSGVAPGVVANYSNQENVKMLGEDIRFIKTGDLHLRDKDSFFFGTLLYYLWYIIPALLFTTLFFIFRKQAKENANIALMRTKKANKVANKRLKKAAVYLKENQKEAFYEEILRALWGYLSDKLNIPMSQLSKDNVESELKKQGATESLTGSFMDIIHVCEFARYAPVGENDSMEKVYDRTVSAINSMENTIKIKVKN